MINPFGLTKTEIKIFEMGETSGWSMGVKAECERIIKLLEDDTWHHISFVTRSPDEEQTRYHDGECLGCRIIALIKGEQK